MAFEKSGVDYSIANLIIIFAFSKEKLSYLIVF